MSRLKHIFANRHQSGDRFAAEKLLNIFITAGYPGPEYTVPLVLELEASGADMIELGMPFSDPLADGPTIQHASNVALQHGITLNEIFDMVSDIRRSSGIPLILMGYINPVLQFGMENFFRKAAECGVDGVILPDAPPGEMSEIDHCCRRYGLDMIYLVAPNTPDERMKAIDEASSGFVYCVSVTGVTGSREGDELTKSVDRFIRRVKKNITRNPVLIGFGIRSHEDARRIAMHTDGFIVGSSLIDLIREEFPSVHWMEKAGQFVRELKYGSDA